MHSSFTRRRFLRYATAIGVMGIAAGPRLRAANFRGRLRKAKIVEVFRQFVASFQSPWVKAYFDLGNHVRYAPPQDWIRTLGPLLVKLHIKDYKLNPNGHGGKMVHPRDGSIDWPVVRRTLDEVDYDGWATIEDDGLSLAEFSHRFDLIASGQ